MEASTPQGLTSSAAEALRQRFGPNEAATKRRSPLAQILPLLGNPLALVLLVASGLSALLGQRVDAAVIAGIVTLSVGINLMQTWRSQKAAEKLRQAVAPTATVASRRPLGRASAPRGRPRRRHPPLRRAICPGGRPPGGGARPARARGGADRRVAAGGEAGAAPGGRSAGTVWLGHVHRQRHGHRRGDRDGQLDAVRRRRPAPRGAPPRRPSSTAASAASASSSRARSWCSCWCSSRPGSPCTGRRSSRCSSPSRSPSGSRPSSCR